MCIAHGHGHAGVPQDLLQYQDVAATHHKVAGEGVPQYVGGSAFWQLDRGRFQYPAKGHHAVTEQAFLLEVGL